MDADLVGECRHIMDCVDLPITEGVELGHMVKDVPPAYMDLRWLDVEFMVLPPLVMLDISVAGFIARHVSMPPLSSLRVRVLDRRV
jgi:hypothetical protein